MSYGAVRIRGLKKFTAVLQKADKGLRREMLGAVKDAGEVVRLGAERLAYGHGVSGRITGIREDDEWGRMRLGISARQAIVYVAPLMRGRKHGALKRPNFAGLLMDEAMQPALDQNAALVEKKIGEVLDDLGDMWTYRG